MEQLVLKPCIRKLGAVALTLSLFGLVYGAEASSLSVKEQQDLFAYEVFIDFWNVQPSSWRNEYSEIQHLQSARELAIQDLDRSKSRLAHRALAYLSLLGLDGGVSEVHGCATVRVSPCCHISKRRGAPMQVASVCYQKVAESSQRGDVEMPRQLRSSWTASLR